METPDYDKFATNCEGCGWLRQGNYTDGFPYLYCFWHGTIMHDQGTKFCNDYRTPMQAKRYINNMNKKLAENKRLAAKRKAKREEIERNGKN